MNTNSNKLLFFLILLFVANSCHKQVTKEMLVFKDFPNLKIGFSTQNFQKAVSLSVESLTQIIEYAAKEGFQFIELRDDVAGLSVSECKELAYIAKKNEIEIIYEIQKNPLDTGFFKVFEKSFENVMLLPGPGILRTVISKSEFDADTTKKGWNIEELLQLSVIADSCAVIAEGKNIKFIVENFNESFFGDSLSYFGLTDFFAHTSITGLQFDISNPFSKNARERSDPDKVVQYLSTMGDRWITSHLKAIYAMGGSMQPILTENPIPIEKVVSLMGQQNVCYAALELASANDLQQCFINHTSSINYLIEKNILYKVRYIFTIIHLSLLP